MKCSFVSFNVKCFHPFITRTGLMLMFQDKLKTLYFMDTTVSILTLVSNNTIFKWRCEAFRGHTGLSLFG